jgi:hypothetical protein
VELGGTLDEALTSGVLLGARYVELYQNDADNPAYQTALEIQGDAKATVEIKPLFLTSLVLRRFCFPLARLHLPVGLRLISFCDVS